MITTAIVGVAALVVGLLAGRFMTWDEAYSMGVCYGRLSVLDEQLRGTEGDAP